MAGDGGERPERVILPQRLDRVIVRLRGAEGALRGDLSREEIRRFLADGARISGGFSGMRNELTARRHADGSYVLTLVVAVDELTFAQVTLPETP